jgi:glucose-1-phosphate cytidylyltransferase
MKVVLFCGGQGMRLRESAESLPKPLVPIGSRPILLHLMSYYAHFGHKDFILCLGHQGDAIKNYFLEYNEAMSNDFVLSGGQVELLGRDIQDWRITFVNTGLHSNIGERLYAVRRHLQGEELFLANYADGLSNLPLPDQIAKLRASNCVGSMLCVPAPHTFHIVSIGREQRVAKLEHVGESVVRVNGGFFVFRQEIFDYMKPGDELVHEPFQRLIREERLLAYPYDGFWANMDTFKDKQRFEDMLARGDTPWRVWEPRALDR